MIDVVHTLQVRKWALAALTVLSVNVAGVSNGLTQTYDKSLEGLRSLNISVERLSENDKACGLTEDLLRRAVSFPIATSQLKIEERNAPVLNLTVTTLHPPAGWCATAWKLELLDFADATLSSGKTKFVTVQL